jgi:hypothetical protein
MDNRTTKRHIQCRSCTAGIDVSVPRPERNNATIHDKAIEKESLNERLVDYGWLPTSKGCYCPRHAHEARASFRHPNSHK